jgi:type II secretory pathway pseudopilin PulG
MGLHGQASERGYAMAALLVMIAIMLTLMTAAGPIWRHLARREKEAELVFRGEQYARAIALYRTKNANLPNAFPPSIDVLVEGKYLRKKYKDPMTKDGEFVPIAAAGQQPGVPGGNPQTGRGRAGQPQPSPVQPQPGAPQPPTAGPAAGGVMGVRSKSTETSLRSYRGATRYDMWQFTFNVAPRPGGAMPMAGPGEGARNPDTATTPGGFPQGPGSGRAPRGGQGRRGFGGPGMQPTAPVLPPGGRGRGVGPGRGGGGL